MIVRIVLDGPTDDVMTVVGMALEAGVLHSMNTDEKDITIEKRSSRLRHIKTNKELLGPFSEGRKVVVTKYYSSENNACPVRGTTGRVISVTPAKQGRGGQILVEWDSGERSSVRSSSIEPTRRK